MHLQIELRKYYQNRLIELGFKQENLHRIELANQLLESEKSFFSHDYVEEIALKSCLLLVRLVFYDEGYVVNTFNSTPIYLKHEILKTISFILKSSTISDADILVVGFLAEFLLLYDISSNEAPYQNHSDNKEYQSFFHDIFPIKYLHKEVLPIVISFYDKVILDDHLGLGKNFGRSLMLRTYLIHRRFNLGVSNHINYLSAMVASGRHLESVVSTLGSEEEYSVIIRQLLSHLYDFSQHAYQHDINLLVDLSRKTRIDDGLIASLLNGVFNQINTMIQNYTTSDVSPVQLIHEIDLLREKIKTIHECENFPPRFKSSVQDSRKKLFFFKRFVTSDEDRIKNNLQSFPLDFSLSNNEIDQVRQTVKDYPIRGIYNLIRVRPHSTMKQAIIQHSNYPISYIIKTTTIDSTHGFYHTEPKRKDAFKQYFDRYGKQLHDKLATEDMNREEGDKQLLNYLDKGFYDSLLKHIETTDKLLTTLYSHLIDDNIYVPRLREELCTVTGTPEFDNRLYDSLISLNIRIVQYIESGISEIISQLSLNERISTKNLSSKMSQLFIHFSDIEMRDDLFNIYYVLYNPYSEGLRNRFMHGNFSPKSTFPDTLKLVSAMYSTMKLMQSTIEEL
jgi:hypothetical protein